MTLFEYFFGILLVSLFLCTSIDTKDTIPCPKNRNEDEILLCLHSIFPNDLSLCLSNNTSVSMRPLCSFDSSKSIWIVTAKEYKSIGKIGKYKKTNGATSEIKIIYTYDPTSKKGTKRIVNRNVTPNYEY